jgi:hypothetical protein
VYGSGDGHRDLSYFRFWTVESLKKSFVSHRPSVHPLYEQVKCTSLLRYERWSIVAVSNKLRITRVMGDNIRFRSVAMKSILPHIAKKGGDPRDQINQGD